MEMLNICGYFMLWYGMGGTDYFAKVLSCSAFCPGCLFIPECNLIDHVYSMLKQ